MIQQRNETKQSERLDIWAWSVTYMLTGEMPQRSVINTLTYCEKVEKDGSSEKTDRCAKGEVSSDSLKWSSNKVVRVETRSKRPRCQDADATDAVKLLRILARIGKQRNKMIWQAEEQQGREKGWSF